MKWIMGKSVRDTLEELIDPAQAALIVIDVQNDFCHPDGHFARAGRDTTLMAKHVPTMVRTVQAAQAAGICTIFVRQETLPEGRSDSPAWLRFKTRDGKTSQYTLPDSWGWQFVDGLKPGPSDAVVTKYRPDAFLHTNLEQLLRANGVETVVILGTTTEGCVESSARGASYRDFYVVVVEDAVATSDPTLHEGSLRLMKARFPTLTAQALIDHWGKTQVEPEAGAA